MAKLKGAPPIIGKSQVPNLGTAVLGMLAVGLAGGAALIAGADKAGKAIKKHEEKKANEVKEYDIPLYEVELYDVPLEDVEAKEA